MVKLQDRINAELENILRVLEQLPDPGQLNSLSYLELAGVAALLHLLGAPLLSASGRASLGRRRCPGRAALRRLAP